MCEFSCYGMFDAYALCCVVAFELLQWVVSVSF